MSVREVKEYFKEVVERYSDWDPYELRRIFSEAIRECEVERGSCGTIRRAAQFVVRHNATSFGRPGGMTPFQGYDMMLPTETQGFTLGYGMTPVPGYVRSQCRTWQSVAPNAPVRVAVSPGLWNGARTGLRAIATPHLAIRRAQRAGPRGGCTLGYGMTPVPGYGRSQRRTWQSVAPNAPVRVAVSPWALEWRPFRATRDREGGARVTQNAARHRVGSLFQQSAHRGMRAAARRPQRGLIPQPRVKPSLFYTSSALP